MCVIPLGGPAGEASDLRDAERRAAPSASDPRSTEAPGPTTTAWGRCLLGAHLRRVLGADERAQALVLLPAGGAAFEVRPEARDGGVGVGSDQLQLDVTVEQLEALVAADLGLRGSEQTADCRLRVGLH